MDTHGNPDARMQDERALARLGVTVGTFGPDPSRPSAPMAEGGGFGVAIGDGRHAVAIVVRWPGGHWLSGLGLVTASAGVHPMTAALDGLTLADAEGHDLAGLGMLATPARPWEGILNFLRGEPDCDPYPDADPISLVHRPIPYPWSGALPVGLFPEWTSRPLAFDGLCIEAGAMSGRDDPEALDRSVGIRAGDEAAIRRAVESMMADLARMECPHAPTPLTTQTWTPALSDFLADHERGPRRIQAAELHPALAPLLRTPAISDAIDAGLPHEALLAKAIDAWAGRPDLDGITTAKVRRMRAIPGDVWGGDVSGLMHVAAAVTVDRLPDTGEGWRRLAVGLRAVLPFAVTNRLDATCLAYQAIDQDHYPICTVHSLENAGDMANALEHGVLRRLFSPGRFPNRILSLVASRILFGRDGLKAIRSRSDAWHEGEGRTVATTWDVTWPALFEPFAAPGGIEIRCLTSPIELHEEGAAGPDRDGIEGLSHCVATYAPRCVMGEIHVASVRRVIAGGGFVRQATLSIGLAWLNAPHYGIQQLRGFRNAEATDDVKRAVDLLIASIGSELAALDTRDVIARPVVGIPVDGAILAFWDRHLPRARRLAPLDGLAGRIEAMATAIMAEVSAEPDGAFDPRIP